MQDHYAELEIQPGATAAEIRTAYRRLALLHHPDKDLENHDAATERIKMINHAYEVLSNDTKRRQYDLRYHSGRQSGHPNDGRDDDEYYDDVDNFYDYMGFFAFASARGFAFRFRREEQHQYNNADTYAQRRDEELRRQAAEESRREAQEEEEIRERLAKERKAKKDEQKAKEAEQKVREERKERKERQERQENKAKEDEKQKQQDLWKSTGAETEDEKIATCLHSGFCEKTKLNQKLRCRACGHKRGTIAFKCPHCALQICQLCVTTFAERRARGMKPKLPKQDPEPSQHSSSQTEGEKTEAGTGPKATPSKKKQRGQGRKPKTTHAEPEVPSKSVPNIKSANHADSKSQRTDKPAGRPNVQGNGHRRPAAENLKPHTGGKSEVNPTTHAEAKTQKAKTTSAPRGAGTKPSGDVNDTEAAKRTGSMPKARTHGPTNGATMNTKGQKKNIKLCFVCHKPGHLAKTCRQAQKADGSHGRK